MAAEAQAEIAATRVEAGSARQSAAEHEARPCSKVSEALVSPSASSEIPLRAARLRA